MDVGDHQAHTVEQRRDHGGPAGGGNPPDHREPFERHPGLLGRPGPERAVEVDGGCPLPRGGEGGGELEGQGGGPGPRFAAHAEHRAPGDGAAGNELPQLPRQRDRAVSGEQQRPGAGRGIAEIPAAPRRRVGAHVGGSWPGPWTGHVTERMFGLSMSRTGGSGGELDRGQRLDADGPQRVG